MIGRTKAIKEARKLGIEVRIMKLAIAFMLGYLFAAVVGAHVAMAATAETSVTVVISAEVACNPENCPEIPVEEPAQVQSVQQEGGWWSKVVQWWQELFE